MTVVVITHNLEIAKMADQVIRLKNGKVIDQYVNKTPLPVSQIEW